MASQILGYLSLYPPCPPSASCAVSSSMSSSSLLRGQQNLPIGRYSSRTPQSTWPPYSSQQNKASGTGSENGGLQWSLGFLSTCCRGEFLPFSLPSLLQKSVARLSPFPFLSTCSGSGSGAPCIIGAAKTRLAHAPKITRSRSRIPARSQCRII
jgi:hypothetical protein